MKRKSIHQARRRSRALRPASRKKLLTQEQIIMQLNKKRFPNARAKVNTHWESGTPLRSSVRVRARRNELQRQAVVRYSFVTESSLNNEPDDSYQIPTMEPAPRGALHENLMKILKKLEEKANDLPPSYSSVVSSGVTGMFQREIFNHSPRPCKLDKR